MDDVYHFKDLFESIPDFRKTVSIIFQNKGDKN